MARTKGAKNYTPAKTGGPRARCADCNRRRYIADMNPVNYRRFRWPQTTAYVCKDTFDCGTAQKRKK